MRPSDESTAGRGDRSSRRLRSDRGLAGRGRGARSATRLRPLVILLMMALGAAIGVLAQEEPSEPAQPEVWAIQAPLAARSLLLDVALAGDRLVAVGERGHILLSDDSGGSWRQAPVPTRATLTAVCFSDGQLGWAVGHDAVILRTRDGGETWELTYQAPEEETPLLDVWFADADRGFAIGAYGLFAATRDGGASWEWPTVEEGDYHLHQISRAADGRLYMAAEAGMLFASDDGGSSWIELASPYDGSFFGTLPLDDGAVLAFGLRGHLYRSEDRGDTWQQLETGTVALLSDGIVLDDGRPLIVGLGGALLIGDEAGRSFTLHPQPSRLGASAVVQGPDGALVLVGEGGPRRLQVGELVAAAGERKGGMAP